MLLLLLFLMPGWCIVYPMFEPVACLNAEVEDEGERGTVAVIEGEVHHLGGDVD